MCTQIQSRVEYTIVASTTFTFLPHSTFKSRTGINQAPGNTDINTQEAQPREYVVSSDEHSNVTGQHIFQTADDRSRQGRVRARAQEDCQVEHRSHQGGKNEVGDEAGIRPEIEILDAFDFSWL